MTKLWTWGEPIDAYDFLPPWKYEWVLRVAATLYNGWMVWKLFIA